MTDAATPALVAIYPGTFDPITRGHLHLIRRASRLVSRLVVSVAAARGRGARKQTLFPLDERVALARAAVGAVEGLGCPVEVVGFECLLVDHARAVGAGCIVRGLRALSDFEYEFQMTGMNARLDPGIETLFLMAPARWQFVSASAVREIAAFGGDVGRFVTPGVAAALAAKLGR